MLRRMLLSLTLLVATLLPTALRRRTGSRLRPAPGPIYIVQPNEYLSTIADRFDIDINLLMLANGISNPDLISEGARLVIPGLEGVTGILDTEIVNFGDSFRSLVRRTRIPSGAAAAAQPCRQPNGVLRRRRHDHSEAGGQVYPTAAVDSRRRRVSPCWKSALTRRHGYLDTCSHQWTCRGVGMDCRATACTRRARAPTNSFRRASRPHFGSARSARCPLQQGSTAEILVSPVEGVKLSRISG